MYTLGIREYLLIQMPIALIGGTFGIWIFYVQHNFPGTYFTRQKEWDHLTASLRRSLDALFLSLWDEAKKKLVSFQDIKKRKRKRATESAFDKA